MNVSFIISIISLGLCICGFIFFRWYIKVKTDPRILLVDYRDEVYRLIAEIDAVTDRDMLLVEERIKTLRLLLDDTDRRLSVYMRELQRSHNSQAMYTNLGRGIRAALNSQQPSSESQDSGEIESAPPQPEKTTTLSSPQAQQAQRAPLTQRTPSSKNTKKNTVPKTTKHPAKRTRTSSSSPQPSGQPSKAKIKVQIAEMSARGLPPAHIASNLGLSVAEVDLALNLLQQQ